MDDKNSKATLSKDKVLFRAPNQKLTKAATGSLELINNNLVFSDSNGAKLFSMNVNEITKIWQSLEVLSVFDKNTSLMHQYVFYFPGWKGALAGTNLGLAGSAMEYQAQKSSGIQDWITALQQVNPNIKIRNLSYKKILVISGVIAVVLIAVITAIVLLTSKGH